MATKLNQIIAIEKGTKSRSLQELTEAHRDLQKPALLSGISRTYRPKDEEGEQLPPRNEAITPISVFAVERQINRPGSRSVRCWCNSGPVSQSTIFYWPVA